MFTDKVVPLSLLLNARTSGTIDTAKTSVDVCTAYSAATNVTKHKVHRSSLIKVVPLGSLENARTSGTIDTAKTLVDVCTAYSATTNVSKYKVH
jgi:hypothetical protein